MVASGPIIKPSVSWAFGRHGRGLWANSAVTLMNACAARCAGNVARQIIRTSARIPSRRFARSAGLTLLCSDEASWITGQVIAVDGGSSLMDPGLPLELQQA